MATPEQQQALRQLPAVHLLIHHPRLEREWSAFSLEQRTILVNEVLARLRERYLGEKQPTPVTEEGLLAEMLRHIRTYTRPHLRPVINATGIVLHTNLGRAVLSQAATRAIQAVAHHTSNLEYRLEEGKRGSRFDHVEGLICRLTGAEAALVVNNNAAAVFLVLRELARQREVLVSRGQLVEIGGSFRVSEIMGESGARLVEVGTTNKTRIDDYRQALSEETGLLLKVHTSNFKMIGFTGEATRWELTGLAREADIPFFEDLGSGLLYDLRQHGIGEEPVVRECVAAGVDLLSFSGDRLLGGPQAGLIVGKKRWIERLKRNQLTRSLRVDKFTLAGLEATLRHYLDPREAAREIPTLRQILRPEEELQEVAHRLTSILHGQLGERVHIEPGPCRSEIGGGSMPGVELPSWGIQLSPRAGSVARLERHMRHASTPVVGRISRERLLLDLRTVEETDWAVLIESLREAVASASY